MHEIYGFLQYKYKYKYNTLEMALSVVIQKGI